jgi:hypothetical protein
MRSITLPLALSFALGLGLGVAQPMMLSLLARTAPANRLGEAAGLRIMLVNGTQTVLLDADSNGSGRVTTDVLEITGGSDLAERFDVHSPAAAPTPTPTPPTIKSGGVADGPLPAAAARPSASIPAPRTRIQSVIARTPAEDRLRTQPVTAPRAAGRPVAPARRPEV